MFMLFYSSFFGSVCWTGNGEETLLLCIDKCMFISIKMHICKHKQTKSFLKFSADVKPTAVEQLLPSF